MPWVAGVYTRTDGVNSGSTVWAQDEAQGFDIITSHHDTHDQDLATGLNNCVTKDGLNKISANFLPSADDTYTIGSATFRWQIVNVSGSLALFNGASNAINLQAGTLTASRTVNFPDAAGNVVIDAATQTLTNKTLTSPTITGGSISGLSAALGVASGGTGLATLAAHALYVGNGTGAPNAVGLGTAGQVLTSNGASADPTFQALPTFNGGSITGALSTSSTISINDPSNTASPLLTVRKSGTTPYASFDTPLLTLQSNDATNDNVVMRFTASGIVNDLGINSSNNMLLRVDATGTPKSAQFWYSDGSVTIGSPTGGNKGNGTLNIAGGLYLNGIQGLPARACAFVAADGSLVSGSFGIGSVTKTGTGTYVVSISNAFGGTGFACIAQSGSVSWFANEVSTSRTTNSVTIEITGLSGDLSDQNFSVAIFGT